MRFNDPTQDKICFSMERMIHRKLFIVYVIKCGFLFFLPQHASLIDCNTRPNPQQDFQRGTCRSSKASEKSFKDSAVDQVFFVIFQKIRI